MSFKIVYDDNHFKMRCLKRVQEKKLKMMITLTF